MNLYRPWYWVTGSHIKPRPMRFDGTDTRKHMAFVKFIKRLYLYILVHFGPYCKNFFPNERRTTNCHLN